MARAVVRPQCVEQSRGGLVVAARCTSAAGIGTSFEVRDFQCVQPAFRISPSTCEGAIGRHLYADNIAINGGVRQHAQFELNVSFELEDAHGW